jgi:beta-N-acetylhexosaminidase
LFDQTRCEEAQAIVKSEQRAAHFGWLMAAELMAFDIDISFAPVLDVRGISEVIGDRSFHHQAEHVIRLASHFIRGMNEAGMQATGKHFPGHGSVKEDSHVAMPVDRRERSEIFALDMHIFKAIHQQGLLAAVMPAHVIYPAIDELPAGFSTIWIQQILRKELAFDGVVFSDDLSMQGAVQMGSIVDRARLAQAAGCDMVLVCNNPKGASQVIDALPSNLTATRVKQLRKGVHVDFATLQKSPDYRSAKRALDEFHAHQ